MGEILERPQAPAQRRLDIVKLGLYAKFGVPEVWIIDLFGPAIEVYREPKEGACASRERLSDGLLVPTLVPGVTIVVAGLIA
jgi:Uma2 family endonuclease